MEKQVIGGVFYGIKQRISGSGEISQSDYPQILFDDTPNRIGWVFVNTSNSILYIGGIDPGGGLVPVSAGATVSESAGMETVMTGAITVQGPAPATFVAWEDIQI